MSDPSEARGNAITAREILDKATEDIDTGLSKDPELQAKLLDLMGVFYDHLGLYPRAEPRLRRSIEIERRVLGPENGDTLRSLAHLTNTLMAEGRYAEAEKWCRETLDIQRRVLGPDHPDALISMNNLG